MREAAYYQLPELQLDELTEEYSIIPMRQLWEGM